MPRLTKKNIVAASEPEPELVEADTPEPQPDETAVETAVEFDASTEVEHEEPTIVPKKKIKSTKRVSRAAVDDEPKPKRALNAYMIFSNEQRSQYDSKTMKVTEIAKEIGAKWRELNEEERTRYKQMALDLKTAA